MSAGAACVHICIGCGCDDLHACTEPSSGDACSWLAVAHDQAGQFVGVCSACSAWLPEWNAGRRHLSTLANLRHHQIERDTTL